METQIKCPSCGEPFTPDHGNETYCSDDCYEKAKRERQRKKRNPIARFIPILMANHRIFDDLNNAGKTELTKDEVEAHRLDISLCRHMHPPPEHEGKVMLDFGEYFLLTQPDFLNFKLYKHDTLNATETV